MRPGWGDLGGGHDEDRRRQGDGHAGHFELRARAARLDPAGAGAHTLVDPTLFSRGALTLYKSVLLVLSEGALT